MLKKIFKLKIVWIFILIMITSYQGVRIYADKKLENKTYEYSYNDCNKIWSARGMYGGKIEQNSLASLNSAFKVGASGVEIDLYYDVEKKLFIISHNHPKKNADGTLSYSLKNGKLLTLKEVFNTFNKDYYFWLDYKNLGDLSAEETKEAIKRLLVITVDDDLRQRVYIEGTNPLKLANYSYAGLKTIFDIQPLSASSWTTSIVLNLYKAAFAYGNFTVMGMKYGSVDDPVYGKQTEEFLAGIPVFLYHVPDYKGLIEALLNHTQVRVMLVGRDKSLNNFNLTNCKLTK